jgi:hypothetical protein
MVKGPDPNRDPGTDERPEEVEVGDPAASRFFLPSWAIVLVAVALFVLVVLAALRY